MIINDNNYRCLNNMIVRAAFTGIMSLAGVALFSQPVIGLPEKVHDFGKINEADGKKTYSFSVVNNGNKPLLIQNIVPSCGCTVPDWTKTPISPGGRGSIAVTFDPADRGGTFSKTLSVHTNASPSVVILTIRGEVIAREKTVEDLYRLKIGELRLESSEIPFSGLLKTQKKIRVMPVFNTSPQPLRVEFEEVPRYMEIKTVPSQIRPGQRGLIQCLYYGQSDPRWGFVRDKIWVRINGEKTDGYFWVSANLLEDFSGLSKEDMASAPKFVLLSGRIDIGKTDAGRSSKFEVKIMNDGKRDLIIRDIKPASEFIRVIAGAGISIRPGATGSIELSFTPVNIKGAVTRQVQIVSNDPRNSQAIVLVHAEVMDQGDAR